MEHMGLGFSEFLTGVLSVAFGAWSFALNGARKDLKEIRVEFSDGMGKLTTEISRLREELNALGTRVTKVEVQQQHYHPER